MDAQRFRPATHARFGRFELTLATRELRGTNGAIVLQEQLFQALLLLLQGAGGFASRDEIRAKLWPDVTVRDFERGINVAVANLRKALKDVSAAPSETEYIQTITGRGYKLSEAPQWIYSASDDENKELKGLAGRQSLRLSDGTANQVRSSLADRDSVSSAMAQPQPLTRFRKLALLIAVLAVVAIAGFYYRSHRIKYLSGQDSVIVADFSNDTGDAVFDGTLRQGLSAQLEQSPFLNLVSDARIARTLSLMSQPESATLTPSLAHEVCLRIGSAATIEGSIARLGSHYVLGITALDCHTGDVLANEQVVAKDKDHVIVALGQAATGLRKRLGESLATVQTYDVPLADVTTPSIDALEAYTRGFRALNLDDYAAAISLAKRATELDPNFAAAYLLQGIASRDVGDNQGAAASVSTAYKLRSRVSERERFNIESMYAAFATGDMEFARNEHKIWAQLYAHDSIPPGRLANIDLIMGDYEEAITEYQTALRLDPENGMQYVNLANAYTFIDRPDQAESAIRQAESRHVDSAATDDILYLVAFLRHDPATMDNIASRLLKKPGYEDQILNFESDSAAYAGHLAKGRELSEAAIASAEHAGEKELAAGYAAESALRDALTGNAKVAKLQASRALSMSDGSQVEAVAAIALALAGQATQAERVAADLSKRFPEDTAVQFNYLPAIYSATVLPKDPVKALQGIAPAERCELGWMGNNLDFNGYPVYFRAEALLANHQGALAAAEFQKIIDHPGVVLNEPIGALARLGLGRSYAMSGDTAKAKVTYQEFLSLWKDADSTVPVYQQARIEYAKLQ